MIDKMTSLSRKADFLDHWAKRRVLGPPVGWAEFDRQMVAILAS
ncbi:hypothetical protein A2U01_0004439 [Trifolium medium]|uniref:Uncharacterized protein n=1 Tax=Trifolium medium TaxID=97028 RepID=A0A392M8Z6_9FABA|nr:hypothetical protein [Trifolium medium]